METKAAYSKDISLKLSVVSQNEEMTEQEVLVAILEKLKELKKYPQDIKDSIDIDREYHIITMANGTTVHVEVDRFPYTQLTEPSTLTGEIDPGDWEEEEQFDF